MTNPERRATVHDRLDDGVARMDMMQSLIDENRAAHIANALAVAENTRITKEIKDILDLAKSFFRIMGYVASFAKWATAVGAAVALVYNIFHSGGSK